MAILFAAVGDEFWRQPHRSVGVGVGEKETDKLIFKII